MMKNPCCKVFRMWGILLLAIFAVLSFHMPVRAASAKVLNTSVYTIKVGTTQTFGGTGYTSGKSSNSSVISVKTTKTKETDSWGGVYYECTCKIKAKKTGKATVTLTLQGGYVEKMYFLVTDSDSFEYDTTAIALKKGKSETVKAAAPSGCTVKYSSSKKSVATVNSKGKITAKKKGKAVISAKVYYKGKRIKTMTKTVFVTNSSPYSYDTSSLSLTTGESKTVKATAPGGCTVKYSSSNSSIAKVDSKGKITAVNSGTATVSVKVYYDGDIIKTMKKEVTVSSGCSYELYRVGVSDTYSNCSSCFYLKTEYDDIYSIEIKNNNSYGFVAVLYSDVNYESEMFVNGLMKVSGGYFFVLNFNISGANTISVYERDLEVKQFTVNVLDYDEAEGKWIQSLISEHTTSSMTSFEKMSAICQYLLYQSEFKYLTNLKDTEKALILTTESVPYFVSKRWDSCTSPAALAKIAEAIGGFDYIHNCYSDYSYGTTEWSNTHFFCKVGIGDDIRSYTVCPATSTGEVDSIQYIDFNSTSNLTRIG